MDVTLQEFKQLHALMVGKHYSDELLANILPYYNMLRASAERLGELDLADAPPALVYRAGSVK